MVSPQATQPGNTPHPRPTDWDRDSVRITAQQRRQVLSGFLSDALTVQRAVSEGERIDRETSNTGLRLYTQADLKVSNAAAIQQWIASNLAAYTDNRDFPAVTPR
jgi:hypothetical protein